MRIVPTPGGQSGFTLIEVMLAALVLLGGVLGTFVLIDGASTVTRDNNGRTSATAVAREILEEARVVPYDAIADSPTPADGLVAHLRQKPHLAGAVSDGGAWVLNRRGLELTVAVQTCTFDDPSDGLGDPAPADPCPAGTGSPGTRDSNPDDFRRVKLTLKWKRGASTREIVKTSQIVNPGGGLGPRILTYDDPATVTSGSELALRATSTVANTVRWTVDDGRSSGVAGMVGIGGKEWGWRWQLGTVGAGAPGVDWALDGTYAVNAQPYDSRGVPGEVRVATVTLSRRVPLAPALVGGGRSGQAAGDADVVEMDWLANPERDVIGYRVYRRSDAGKVRICPPAGEPVTRRLSCIDGAPPAGAPLVYEVVAVDAGTAGGEGGDPLVLTVGERGVRLGEPSGVLVASDNGRPQLTWSAPPVPAGERILFYRIYRDGSRYTRTVSDATTWTDTSPAATSHRYQVTAVHQAYNEGAPSVQVSWP